MKKLLHRLAPVFAVVLFTAALWLIHRELGRYQVEDIGAAVRAIPLGRVAAAFVLTVCSFVALMGYDGLSLRWVRKKLPARNVAFTAFEGFAFSQSFSLGGLTGASVRYRLYSRVGLSAADVATVALINGISFWSGFLTLLGIALLVEPAPPEFLHWGNLGPRVLGLFCLCVVVGVLIANAVRRRPWRIARWSLQPPGPGVAFAQLAIGAVDWALVSGVLFVLLPNGTISYPAFLSLFLIAQVSGLLSHVPGGLGVFETVLLTTLGSRAPAPALVAALLTFRLVYYVLPFVIAAALLAFSEIKAKTVKVSREALLSTVSRLAPPVFSVAVFVAGVMLLLSGAAPDAPERLHALHRILPLPAIELSHFLASVTGAVLLLLARGLQRRQRAAYVLSLALMIAGAVLSLAKAGDWEEASALVLVSGLLAPCGHAFYRRAALTEDRFTPEWVAAVLLVMISSAWLVLFAHKHVPYSADLWWRFELSSHVSRALRAEVGAAVALLFASVAVLFRAARPELTAVDWPATHALVSREPSTNAALALLGDKRFLFSPTHRAMVMYGISGRSWVSLGDPIGEASEQRDLIWAFQAFADRHAGRAVFYQVGGELRETYADIGLGLFKLGEEARVPLGDFSLAGGKRRSLRAAHHRAVREGLSFELIPQDAVPALLPELRRISNEWLQRKNTAEKGFSLGYFDERYLLNFRMAVARMNGELVAFANVLEGADREELSIDLMRSSNAAPRAAMQFLFTELMNWGREQGFRWFNLGMAPFSGLENEPLAPLWNRAGAFLFRHGEQFYNFAGLRGFKEQFDPVWTARYLASPAGPQLPFVLADIAVLVSGGVRAVIGKGGARLRREDARVRESAKGPPEIQPGT